MQGHILQCKMGWESQTLANYVLFKTVFENGINVKKLCQWRWKLCLEELIPFCMNAPSSCRGGCLLDCIVLDIDCACRGCFTIIETDVNIAIFHRVLMIFCCSTDVCPFPLHIPLRVSVTYVKRFKNRPYP